VSESSRVFALLGAICDTYVTRKTYYGGMSDLDSKTKRKSLEPGKRHQEPLAEGRYLVYRKAPSVQTGIWSVKYWDAVAKKSPLAKLAMADDVLAANGTDILTYDQAVKAADGKLKAMLREADLIAGGEEVFTGSYTVDQAWADYITDAKRRGVTGIYNMQTGFDAQIHPALGHIEVRRLTEKRIRLWHQDLAEMGKRKTGKTREKPEFMDVAKDDEDIRRRRDTANRILTNLKAALNFAYRAHKVEEDPWRRVKPFANVGSNRVRFLTKEEQQKLVAGATDDLKPLLLGGLYTGARCKELRPVQVRDFDPIHGTLFLARGKGKGGSKSRTVMLTDEGIAYFKEYVQGKKPGDLMFQHISIKRRKAYANPLAWAENDQIHAMEAACAASGVEPVTFHELRHTYASTMLTAGFSATYLAEQFGHEDQRMIERYYGHITKVDMKAAVRRVPSLGLTSSVGEVQPVLEDFPL